MKRLFLSAMSVFLSVGFSTASAGSVDSEGMPIIYLRGNFGSNNWGVQDAYRFSRSGNTYSLIISHNNAIGECEFKISDDDWSWNLGADIAVDASSNVECYHDGPNMKTSGLSDAIITFSYEPYANPLEVSFIVDGEELEPEPEPSPFPEVYLRGNFGGTGWNISDAYRFSCNEDGIYTLAITSANPVEAGSNFKIGDEDWSVVDLGGPQKDLEVDYSQNLRLTHGGANLKTVNGIYSGLISFAYDPESDDGSAIVSFTIDGTQKPPVSGISGSLPVLYINVYADEAHTAYDNEVISKDLSHKNYFDYAEYWLDLNGCKWLEDLGAKSVGSEEEPLALQIKARGNYTRIAFSKKPFKLKLDKKQSLLGLSKSKHFAILAHADDNKGYLRNFTGFNLGKRIGLPWTPSQQPVEVVINGDYRGLYFLTESIRVDEDRVNITELGDNVDDASLISGGYIVELDNYDEDDINQIRMEEKHISGLGQHYDMLRITFDTPEEYSDLQRLFITDQFTAMNNYVGANDNALWSYLDLDDAARYYLVNEIVSHTEAFHGSTYLFRDYGEGRKWHFSPLWDFGNAFNGNTDSYFYNCDPFGNTWIPSMRENRKFNDKVKETWLWFMANEYEGLEEDIDEYSGHLVSAAQADYRRWHNQPTPSGGREIADNRDMAGKAREVKSHLSGKISWLKGKFGDFTSGVYAEPERDDTAPAPLPTYVSTDIVDIIDFENPDLPVEYYDLQGMPVSRPQPGNIYILRQGSKVAKILYR